MNSNPFKPGQFARRLIKWHRQHGRHQLPWQIDIHPYRVWISEIMLQQTQVSTVIPYFEKFMARFPTVTHLAGAKQDEVLHYWSGLGYYARGRNLHKAAQLIVDQFDGELPSTLDELSSLPGIGLSTAGAILSIAFQQPATILDGNVKRVLSRCFGLYGWPDKTDIKKIFWELANSLTPKTNTATYTQAIMDLGANLCRRRNPLCEQCPLADNCYALAHLCQHDLPSRKPKKSLPTRHKQFLILQHEEQVYLEKRASPGLWGGLWCFPEIDLDASLQEWATLNQFTLEDTLKESWPPFKHTFSHFHLAINPLHISFTSCPSKIMDSEDRLWYNLTQAKKLGLATPVAKLLKQLKRLADDTHRTV